MFQPEDHTFALCAYGESPYLEECLGSLESQAVRTGIIICTSTPNALIETFAATHRVPLFISGSEPGIASDWNFAIKSASTSLITIAHQDDIYCPSYTETMLECMNDSTSPLIFSSDYGEIKNGQYINSNRLLNVKRMMIAPLKQRKWQASKFWKRNILRFGSPICCPSVTYNKMAIPSPLFTEGMRGGLDWEAWERLSKIPGAFCYSPDILMYHRIHEESETSKIIADKTRVSEDLELFKKFWPAPVARMLNRFYSESLKSNAE